VQLGLALILVPLLFFSTLLVVGVLLHIALRAERTRRRTRSVTVGSDASADEATRRLARTKARMNDVDVEVRRWLDTGKAFDHAVSNWRYRLVRRRTTLERTNRRALVPAARTMTFLTRGQRPERLR
jgi:hypothetical protein